MANQLTITRGIDPRCFMLSIFFSFLIFYASGQTKLSGKIIDTNGLPMANASVVLLQAKDSSAVKGVMTNKEGRYGFENIRPGSYLLASTFIGYRQVYSPIFSLQSEEHFETATIKLTERETSLSKVTIRARKPFIEQTIDRLVINVANNITSAGSTALDVLERSPGVIVDRQNNALSINGKDGVVVMLDGRITHMPLAGLVQMLAGMPADNIEKIELITTPPSSLDAEGNAGYINIVLKHSGQYGTNGNYILTAGYSKGEVLEASMNFNHRKGKINVYGDYSFTRRHIAQPMNFYHAVTNNNGLLENYSFSNRTGLEGYHDGKIGIDIDAGKSTVMGALFTVFSHRWIMDAMNNSQVYYNKMLDTTILLKVHEFHPTSSYDMNVNLQHLGKEGEKIAVNIDYMFYNDLNPVSYFNSYFNNGGSYLFDDQLRSNKKTPIHIWVAAVDYTKTLNKKLTLETGAKTTLSHFTNDVQVDQMQSGSWESDASLSALYHLDENITAAYSSVNWSASKKTNMKMGLRYEYTNSNLGTEKLQNIVDKHYGNLFPSFFLSNAMNENHSINFSYSRRVTRPTFWNLAPFVIFMDPNTYFSGNPGLQPSITDNINLGYTFKKKLLSLSYSYEANPITNFSPKIDPKTNKETLAAENQDNRKTINVALSLPFDITKWWSLQANINGTYQKMIGNYDGSSIVLKNERFNFYAQQNFSLPKRFTLSLSGFYQSTSLWGIYKFYPVGTVDIGLQKKLSNNTSTFRLNFSNILNTLVFRPEVNLPDKNLIANARIIFTPPAVRLTFTHSFGSDKVKSKRVRSSGTEDEKERLRLN